MWKHETPHRKSTSIPIQKHIAYSQSCISYSKRWHSYSKTSFILKHAILTRKFCRSYFHVIIIRLTCDLYSETTFTFDNFTWLLADFIGNMNCDLIYIVVWKGFIGWPPTEWMVLGWKLWNKSNFIFSFSNFFL